MDMSAIAARLGLFGPVPSSARPASSAAYLPRVPVLLPPRRRASDLGLLQGEVCKAIISLDIAASNYKERFLAALPPSCRASTDFGRPVFTATAFYLCAKMHKVSTSLTDLCFNVFGIAKEKSEPKSIKGNRAKGNKDDSDSSASAESSDNDQDELHVPKYCRERLQVLLRLLFEDLEDIKSKQPGTGIWNFVIPKPEVTVFLRAKDDVCLILARTMV